MHKWEIPTQACVLAHTTQMKAIELGAPADLVFQSIAGTQAANDAFGYPQNLLQKLITGRTKRNGYRPQSIILETGQGSEISLNATTV